MDWLSAEANLTRQQDVEQLEADRIERGREAVVSGFVNCMDCHVVEGVGEQEGPELTGWASRDWMLRMLHNPAHPTLYGEDNDRMPAFGADEILTERDMGLIVDWIREDWYRATEGAVASRRDRSPGVPGNDKRAVRFAADGPSVVPGVAPGVSCSARPLRSTCG